jgi:hypothetical protein
MSQGRRLTLAPSRMTDPEPRLQESKILVDVWKRSLYLLPIIFRDQKLLVKISLENRIETDGLETVKQGLESVKKRKGR